MPDLRGRSTVGVGTGIYATGVLPTVTRGQKIGAPTAAMLVPLPQHTHTLNLSSMSADGQVSLPLSGSVSNLPFSSTPTLNVTGKANIATKGATLTNTQRSNVPSDNALLVTPQAPTASIYSADNTLTANTIIGPNDGVTGTATGTVSGTASGGTLTGNASGNVTLPVTGTGGISPAGVAGAFIDIPTQTPALGMKTCIVVNGVLSRPAVMPGNRLPTRAPDDFSLCDPPLRGRVFLYKPVFSVLFQGVEGAQQPCARLSAQKPHQGLATATGWRYTPAHATGRRCCDRQPAPATVVTECSSAW